MIPLTQIRICDHSETSSRQPIVTFWLRTNLAVLWMRQTLDDECVRGLSARLHVLDLDAADTNEAKVRILRP